MSIIRALTAMAVFTVALCAQGAMPQLGVGGAGEGGSPPDGARQGPDSSAPMTAAAKTVASGLYMTGQFTYVLQGGTATVTLDGISNDSFTRTTGTLRLALWALTYQPVRGEGINGYRLATFSTLSPLAPRTFYSSIVRTASHTVPPNGSYWLILVLDEFNPTGCPSNSDGYCLQDTFTSFQQVSFGVALPTYDYSDLWWNSNESGWGVAILHHTSNIAFVAWYVYDSFGNPKWYVASSCPMVGEGCSGALYEASGPPFGPTFNPGAVRVTNVGSISLNFSSRTTGTFSYNVRGSTATKSISRQPF